MCIHTDLRQYSKIRFRVETFFVHEKGVVGAKCFATKVALVGERVWKVDGLHVVPDQGPSLGVRAKTARVASGSVAHQVFLKIFRFCDST